MNPDPKWSVLHICRKGLVVRCSFWGMWGRCIYSTAITHALKRKLFHINVKMLVEMSSRCDIFTLWPTYDFMVTTSELLPLLCFQYSVLYAQCVNSYCEIEVVFFTFAPNTVKKEYLSSWNYSSWEGVTLIPVKLCQKLPLYKCLGSSACQKNCYCFTEWNFNLLS